MLAGPAQAAPQRATHIVQLQSGVSLAEGQAAVRAAHGDVADTLPIINGLAVRLPSGARARLAHDARIASISANASIESQSDRFDPAQLATAYPASVLAPPVWNSATGATGAGVGVAVIDTGVDGGLVDFSDAQGASRVVASVVTNPDATTPNDNYGHGTHVAGIIAGDSTRRPAGDPLAGRYVGIAPDANLIAIKASDDDGHGTILDAIYGLQFVVDHKADYNIRVVNLSVSSTVAESYLTDPLDAAVEAAYFHGIVVVAAAGNLGTAADAVNYSPANDPYVISVGAVDDQGTTARGDDAFAAWSSVGTTQDGFAKPDLAAPGAHIVSTLAPGSAFGQLCPQCVVDGSYMQIGGTSMAAPVVAGVAALIAPGPSRLDAGPGQVHADRHRPRRPRRHRRGQRLGRDLGLGARVRRERRTRPERAHRPRHRRHRLRPARAGAAPAGEPRPRRWPPAGRARAGAASAPAGTRATRTTAPARAGAARHGS